MEKQCDRKRGKADQGTENQNQTRASAGGTGDKDLQRATREENGGSGGLY